MKLKLLDKLIMLSKLSLYGLVIQCFMLSSIWAEDISAQKVQSVNDVKVELEFGRAKLEKVFRLLESQTDFHFSYSKEDIDQALDVTFKKGQSQAVRDVLIEVSKVSGLKFRQVNRNIIVQKGNSDEGSHSNVEVFIEDVEIQGKITDENGEGLPGAAVVEKGTTNGTTTDLDGNYKLNLPDNAVLVVSFVGYNTAEILLAGRSTIDVQMELDEAKLEEVVVVGYGTQKKSDITGAISSVKAETLEETPALNILQSFQGRTAGVDIVSNGGAPGDGLKIRIRGNRSVSATNNPLIVLDGIPSDLNLNDIAVEDVASLEILKDASSTAIYGSRGANGVVLITTKRGGNKRPQISYNAYYGIKQVINNINYMNGSQFAEFKRIAGGFSPGDNSALTPTEQEAASKGVSTDWLDEVLQSGTQQSHQLSIAGGTEAIKYYSSASYYNEKGVLVGGDYERVTVRANLDIKASDRINFGMSSYVSASIQNAQNANTYQWARMYTPLAEPTDENGSHLSDPNSDGAVFNPLGYLQPGAYMDERRRVQYLINLFGEYKISDNLKYRINFGPGINTFRNGTFGGSIIRGGVNSAGQSTSNTLNYTLENILSYSKEFGGHSLGLTTLFSSQESRLESFSASASDFPVEGALFYDLGATSNLDSRVMNSSLTEWGLLSWMGRLNYSYQDKYLLTLTGRADGSSRLSSGNKWSVFPSVALAWRIANESFITESSIFSDLKLRASYGEVGNTSVDPYQTLGGLGNPTAYVFGTVPGFGFRPTSIPNPFLGWETSKTFNVGLDFALFDHRLSGSLELYNTKTENLLLSRVLPSTSGYTSTLQNIGATQNKGVELTLSFVNVNTESGLKWSTDLSVFSNKEEITELFNGTDDNVANGWFIGEPIDVFFDYLNDGIWQLGEEAEAAEFGQQPGDVRLADVNGRNLNGELTGSPDGMINGDDRVIRGNSRPDWSGGITNRFDFRGFDLSVFVYARQGQLLQSSYHHLNDEHYSGRWNVLNINYWTPENASNEYPRPGIMDRRESSSLRYFDGSFVKVKNISLGYTFTDDAISSLGLSSLNIYTTINNPIIFSKYDLTDPETASGIVGSETDLSSRTFVFGIRAKF